MKLEDASRKLEDASEKQMSFLFCSDERGTSNGSMNPDSSKLQQLTSDEAPSEGMRDFPPAIEVEPIIDERGCLSSPSKVVMNLRESFSGEKEEVTLHCLALPSAYVTLASAAPFTISHLPPASNIQAVAARWAEEKKKLREEIRAELEAEASSPRPEPDILIQNPILRGRVQETKEKVEAVKKKGESALNFSDVSALRNHAAGIQTVYLDKDESGEEDYWKDKQWQLAKFMDGMFAKSIVALAIVANVRPTMAVTCVKHEILSCSNLSFRFFRSHLSARSGNFSRF